MPDATKTLLLLLFSLAWLLIAYTYLAFPVLLALAARFLGGRPHPQRDLPDDECPRVAMVVAAHNEAEVLPAKLANTWAIDYPAARFVLVVGSDGSSDGTEAVLRTCTDRRLQAHLFERRRGKISVLNDLVATADADIVVMSDANTMFAPDAVRKLVRHFADARVGCVSGELSLEQDGGASGEGLYWRYEGWIKRNESRLGFLIGCNGGIFALRRELYTPLPSQTLVEDFVLTMRVLEQGAQVVFEPDARALEPPCPNSRAEMVRKVRIGAGGFQAIGLTSSLLHPRHGLCAFAYWSHKVLRWMVPLFFLVGLGANAGLALRPPFDDYSGLWWAGLAGQVFGAAVALLSYYSAPGSLPRWTRPVSYFYLMNFALLCGFWRFLTGRQRVTWERASR